MNFRLICGWNILAWAYCSITSSSFSSRSWAVGSSVLLRVKYSSLVACTALCNSKTECCFIQTDESWCTILSCDAISVTQDQAGPKTMVHDSRSIAGWQTHSSTKLSKYLPTAYTGTNCHTDCAKPFAWGTFYVPLTEADYQWIVDDLTPTAYKKRIIVGLECDAKNDFFWTDGTPYDGVGGRVIAYPYPYDICLLRDSNRFICYGKELTQGSCLCQVVY